MNIVLSGSELTALDIELFDNIEITKLYCSNNQILS